MRSLLADMLPNPAVERDGLQAALAGRPSAFRAPAAPHTSTLNDSPSRSSMTATGRNDSPASGSFREANFQRRLSGGKFEELSVATRPGTVTRSHVTYPAGNRVERSQSAATG